MFERFLVFLVRKGRYRRITYRDSEETYMDRFYLLFNGNHIDDPKEEKRSYLFNILLHQIRLSDKPVYHSHPWPWISIVLKGGYWEHLYYKNKKTHKTIWRGPGSIGFRKATALHWIELPKGKTSWSLFFHGKRTRKWGFFVKGKEVYWKDYLKIPY